MERPFDRVALVVLDGVGCGEAEDAKTEYAHDVGANSLKHAAEAHPLNANTLLEMGLCYVPGLEGIHVSQLNWPKSSDLRGAYGALRPTHAGNGSPEGHQALMGLRVTNPFLYFADTGIPDDVIAGIERVAAEVIGRPVTSARYPGTDNISGTDFIAHPDVGRRILESRDQSGPAVIGPYVSSDSLVQIAMHQDVTPQSVIKEVGRRVREEVLVGQYGRVGRVIMRPFTGEPGNFRRADADRVDFALNPDGPTLVDFLMEEGFPVAGLGKAGEMFNGQGFAAENVHKMESDDERANAVKDWFAYPKGGYGFLLANLKDTDEKFGHRRLPEKYIQHIIAIGEIMRNARRAMTERDLLIITSDHGNDPTHKFCADNPSRVHTNHTRENVPVLAFSPRMKKLVELGVRKTFEDVAATIGENFGVEGKLSSGESFLRELLAA